MRHSIFRLSTAVWLPLLVSLLLTGCVKRELEMRPVQGDGEVELSLDWGALPTPPASARCLFYNEQGQLVKEVPGATDVVREALPMGKYRLIVHNEDGRQIDFRGTDAYDLAEVFALSLTEARAATDSHLRTTHLPCILEPKAIYGAGTCREGEWLIVEPNKTTCATVSPTTLTRQVQFRFMVKGDIEVQTLTGMLNGVAPGIFLATGEINRSESCSLQFTALTRRSGQGKGDEADEFTVNLNVFNLLATTDSPAETTTINVTLTDTRGTRYDVSVDITPALQQIIGENGGTIPVEVPVEVLFEVVSIGNITSTVRPWDDSGTGGGKPNWD